NKSILVTGGTGSFGKEFVRTVFKNYPDIKRLIVYSRDELKQFEMAQEFPNDKYPVIRYYIGDVRDASRLEAAFEGVDYVVHAAALKQVPTAEYNPMECIKTNVMGAENVINAAVKKSVKRVVALSTDKAASPINLYGATKLCSDKLFVAARFIAGAKDTRFTVVRYGNVMGSRGSVIPFFMKKREDGVLPITHEGMTRFNILLEEGVALVMYALGNAFGGEILVPKIPSYKITEVAKAIGPDCEVKFIGVRPGEKIHEEMVSEMDSLYTIENNKYYIIVPNDPFLSIETVVERYAKHYDGKPVPFGFRYSSDSNTEWLSADQIRELVETHIGPL
ncbi:MAG: UDP-N-acetylglucosamine 4,6-dehydratase (inverting), partial [Flavobacteriales bacterium]|nr:UDP-N-acetylglucosamine 4,6-dehydratase (inverting) [Flavobacteriales bacterium]